MGRVSTAKSDPLGRSQFDAVDSGCERGFTLIEMMVALAVFSLAALALIRLEGATIRSTGILDQTLVAQMVARNVAVEALTDAQPPTLGTTSGTVANGGRNWTWTRNARALGDAGAIEVDIGVAPGAGAPIAHLMVVRPPSAGGPA
jgi:general secretion pathway protein I